MLVDAINQHLEEKILNPIRRKFRSFIYRYIRALHVATKFVRCDIYYYDPYKATITLTTTHFLRKMASNQTNRFQRLDLSVEEFIDGQENENTKKKT